MSLQGRRAKLTRDKNEDRSTCRKPAHFRQSRDRGQDESHYCAYSHVRCRASAMIGHSIESDRKAQDAGARDEDPV
jgi:hypothetical protein